MGNAAAKYIRWNRTELENLPPPDEEWRFRDVDIEKSTLHSLVSYELIEEVGSRRIDGTPVKVWQTTSYAWRKIQEYDEKDD